MTTPLFLLRCVQLGISIRDLDLLTIGMVNDMYAESSNDGADYAVLAGQEDFDLLVGSIAFLLATFCAPAISENVADYLVGYELEQQETEKNAEQGVKLYLEDDTEVVGVQVAVTGEVILLSVCSVLGIIVAAVLFSCVSVAVKKPQEILSRMS